MLKVLFLLVLLTLVVAEKNCLKNLKVCKNLTDDVLNIHLVPHSHDDVGWLKTVDEYYYGSSQLENDSRSVQSIISSVVAALKRNKNRKFIQVETAFFWKWWKEQNEDVREDFRQLVDNGQIEMVNGAWSMNDEGATNYQSIIDQFTWGLRKINDTVGECGMPKVGWQIDPFGHSREHASLLYQMGFYGMFIGRVDWRDKGNRIDQRRLDFLWKTSVNIDHSNIFTSIFPDFYVAPICFDVLCGTSLVDDENSALYNVGDLTKYMYDLAKEYAAFYRTKNVLIPMGGDFHFQGAEKNYVNIDKLISYFNERYKDTRLIYSTPSCYIGAVNRAATNNNVLFPGYTDDFFPHASDPNAMWNGYFSSRPNSKRNERYGNNILQIAKQLTSIAKMQGIITDVEHLEYLIEAMGIMQHHDAITGTEKFAVSQDYTRLLFSGINRVESTLFPIIQNLVTKNEIDLQYSTCHLANVSICEGSDGDSFIVTIYNPLKETSSPYIRIPVNDDVKFTAESEEGELPTDNIEGISNFAFVNLTNEIPKTREIVFQANNIKPMGLKTYYIKKSSEKQQLLTSDCGNYSFGTEELGFKVDKASGLLNSVNFNFNEYKVQQQFLYYNSAVGNNDVSNQNWTNRASGAYIFRPNGTAKDIPNPIQLTCYRGVNVDEVKQIVNDWITQIIRVYKSPDISYIEFDWLVGPIPVTTDDLVGKEVISRFKLESTNTSFYTDSNGREMIKRTIDHRSFPYNASIEPVAGNYYPVTSKISIKDEGSNIQISVLNDRSQGGSSLNPGEIELMVHRRILHDDAFGVDEALNEEEFGQGVVARGKHYLFVGPLQTNDSTTALERFLANSLLLQPLVAIAPTNISFDELKNHLELSVSFLQTNISKNIKILTLEPWVDDTYILRLEHIFEKEEDDKWSQEVSLNLNDIQFVSSKLNETYEISNVQEVTLGANQYMEDFINEEKLIWNQENNKVKTMNDLNNITLGPMDIKTFLIKINKVNKNM